MAVVPTIVENTQTLRPMPSARVQAADFGAAGQMVGQAVQRFGQEAMGAVQEADHIAAQYDAARAKGIDNQFVEKLRSIEYGDGQGGGFYTTQNGATVNAAKPTREAIDAAYNEALGQAKSPREKAMLQDVLQRRRASSLEGVDRYTQGQQLSFAKVTSADREGLARDGFIRSGGKGDDADANMETIRSEVRQRASLEGMTDANTIRAMELDAVSKAHVGVVHSLMTSDPVAANAYRQSHSSEITADAGSDIDRMLYKPLLDRQAGSDLDGYLGGPVHPDTPAQASPAPSSSAAKVASKIIGAESGGKADAHNPMPGQTASGLGQFTDKTWLNLYRQKMPNAAGLSDAEILALKTDAPTARRMTEIAVNGHVDLLKDHGLPTTDGNVYLSHFLGPKSVDVLRAAPNTPVAGLLPQSFIRANPDVLGHGATAGQVVAWADKKMGGGGVRPSYAPTADNRASIYDWIDGHDDWSFDRKNAVREEADRRIGRGEAIKRTNESAAKDQAVETIIGLGDNFTSTNQIPPQAWAGMDATTRLQFSNWASSNVKSLATASEKRKTDPSTFIGLSDAYATDRQAFLQIRPEAVRGKLDDGDFDKFMTWRRDAQTNKGVKTPKTVTVDTVMSNTRDLLASAGLNVGQGKEALKDAPKVAAFNRTMLDWADGFHKQNGREPNADEIRKQGDRYLVTGGWQTATGGKTGGFAFEAPGGNLNMIQIPAEIRGRIVNAAHAANLPDPTDAEIAHIYVQGKGSKW